MKMIAFPRTLSRFIAVDSILIPILIIIDQTAKHFARETYPNYLGPFNLPAHQLILIVLAFALSLLLLIWLLSSPKQQLSLTIPLALIISGGFSNALDRLIYSYVKDIIALPYSITINLADLFITVGVVAVLIHLFFRRLQTHELIKPP